MIWFSADLHFGHKWMALTHRRWGTVGWHDNHLLDEWNDNISEKDTVHFLGDFSFWPRGMTEEIWYRLKGHKHLVVGNHDAKHVTQLPWESVADFKRIKHDGRSIYLMHYPMLTWPNAHHGTWHLHGHSHGNLRAPESTRMDVGYDAIGKVAISIDEVTEILSARSYDFVDHHDEREEEGKEGT
jgi:calcineurin-like phosphoesterase family protein